MVQRDREGEGFVGCGENVFKLNEPGFEVDLALRYATTEFRDWDREFTPIGRDIGSEAVRNEYLEVLGKPMGWEANIVEMNEQADERYEVVGVSAAVGLAGRMPWDKHTDERPGEPCVKFIASGKPGQRAR